MLELIIYAGKFGEPSGSPFCVKAMCLLKMSGVEWRPVFNDDPRKAPNQKFPVLKTQDGLVPDSEQIRTYLEENYNIDFDEGLSARERAVSHSIIRMCEEHLYFVLLNERWANDENWEQIREAYFSMIPAMFRKFVTGKIRKEVIRTLDGQGMGRHSNDERFLRAEKDLNTINQLLEDGKFLFGDKPSAADATVAALIGAIVTTPVATPLISFVRENDKLMAYLERARATIYP